MRKYIRRNRNVHTEKFTKTRRRLVYRNYSNKPHQIRGMRRLIEDYTENSALLCNVHQPGNNDSLPKKKNARH